MITAILIGACSDATSSSILVDLPDADAALGARHFELREVPSPAPPTPAQGARLPDFAPCASSLERESCFAFAAGRFTSCPAGQMKVPSAAACVPVAECVDAFTDEVGVLFVDDDSASFGDGSHARPFQRIQDAIDASPNLGVVRVQPGRYVERLQISRGVVVEGACPTTTLLTMTTAAPARSREIVSLVDGSLSGFQIAGHSDRREQNWGGVAVVGAGSHGRADGLLLENLAYGLYVGPDAALAVERVRASFAVLTNEGTTNALRLELHHADDAMVHYSGVLNVHDAWIEGEPGPSWFFGIFAPSLATGGEMASGAIGLSQVVITAPQSSIGSLGALIGGATRLSVRDSYFGVDEGIVVEDSATVNLEATSLEVRRMGVWADPETNVTIHNTRLVGLFDTPVLDADWDGVMLGLILLGQTEQVGQTFVGHLRGSAVEGNLAADHILRAEDLTIREIEPVDGQYGYGIVGGHVDLRRVDVRMLNWGVGAEAIVAEDMVIQMANQGVTATSDMQLTRFFARDVDNAIMLDREYGFPYRLATQPSATAGRFSLKDGDIASGNFAAAVSDASSVKFSRVSVAAMSGIHDVLLIRNRQSTLSDVFIRNKVPGDAPPDAPIPAGLVAYESPIVADRLFVDLGAVDSGAFAFIGAPVVAHDCLFRGGSYAVNARVRDEGAAQLSFGNSRVESTTTGIWIVEASLVDRFAEMEFLDVVRPVTLGTLPIPGFSEDDFGLAKPHEPVSRRSDYFAGPQLLLRHPNSNFGSVARER